MTTLTYRNLLSPREQQDFDGCLPPKKMRYKMLALLRSAGSANAELEDIIQCSDQACSFDVKLGTGEESKIRITNYLHTADIELAGLPWLHITPRFSVPMEPLSMNIEAWRNPTVPGKEASPPALEYLFNFRLNKPSDLDDYLKSLTPTTLLEGCLKQKIIALNDHMKVYKFLCTNLENASAYHEQTGDPLNTQAAEAVEKLRLWNLAFATYIRGVKFEENAIVNIENLPESGSFNIQNVLTAIRTDVPIIKKLMFNNLGYSDPDSFDHSDIGQFLQNAQEIGMMAEKLKRMKKEPRQSLHSL